MRKAFHEGKIGILEIVLPDKAESIVEAGTNVQKQFAKNVLLGLTEEETHMCIKVFDKIFCFDKFFLSCT